MEYYSHLHKEKNRSKAFEIKKQQLIRLSIINLTVTKNLKSWVRIENPTCIYDETERY